MNWFFEIMIFCFFILFSFFLNVPIEAYESLEDQFQYEHWFTGPLLTPNPTTLKPGHPGIEVTFFGNNRIGIYDDSGRLQRTFDNWLSGIYADFQMGLTDVFGAEVISAVVGENGPGARSLYFQDTIFRFGIQILNDKRSSWQPDFRILFQETFPTGNYQKLSLIKEGADITGQGSFQTGIHFAFQKLFNFFKERDFRLRWTMGYFIPSKTHVTGLNVFGGDLETRGIVSPGHFFIGYITGEYALSRTWSIGCESNYLYGFKGHFEKYAGPNIDVPEFKQISIAPELGHSFSKTSGMLLGSWFTISGMNTIAFRTFFISYLKVF